VQSPTNADICSDFRLWQEYVDPNGTITEEQFDEMSSEEKRQIIRDCFGDDEADKD
jgi:hypothetical protein